MLGEDTGDIRSHHLPGVKLWLGSSRNWSVFQRRPQYVTPQEGSDSLSMLPVGYTPWWSTDAYVVDVKLLHRICGNYPFRCCQWR